MSLFALIEAVMPEARRLHRWRRLRVRIEIDQAAPDAEAIEQEIELFLARNFDVVHDRRRWLVLARRAAVGGSVPADPKEQP